jgi:regulator of protease activity HflC (stomatin/prohibitin superfamily)
MKKVIIKALEKGLQFKNGELLAVLDPGKYWFWDSAIEIKALDITKPVSDINKIEYYVQHEKLSPLLDKIIIKDNEIALVFYNNVFQSVLGAGTYYYWKEMSLYTFKTIDLNSINIEESIDKNLLKLPSISKYLNIFAIEQYEQGLLFIDGKLDRVLEPGIYYFWKGATPIVVNKVDQRTQQIEMSGQELLTKDKAALRLNFFASYKIYDGIKAIIDTKEYDRLIYVILQLGLREYIGKMTLDELLSNKESASPYILEYASEKLNDVGITLIDCGIRDVILPGEMKDIMNQVLIAEKRAQANIIMRREETASMRSMLNTAKLLEENEMLFRLKEMEYIEKIADKIGDITVNGRDPLGDQLKTIFGMKK